MFMFMCHAMHGCSMVPAWHALLVNAKPFNMGAKPLQQKT